MEDYPHRDAAGEVGRVNQANHAADHTDQRQGGLADGAPWGTCCWEQICRQGGGEDREQQATETYEEMHALKPLPQYYHTINVHAGNHRRTHTA